MDAHHHHQHHHQVVEFDFQFRPIEHPVEPQNEDGPVKWPIPNSYVVKGVGKQDQRNVENLRKRSEVPQELPNEGIVITGGEPPDKVRKKHHALSHGDPLIIPSTSTTSCPSIYANPNQH